MRSGYGEVMRMRSARGEEVATVLIAAKMGILLRNDRGGARLCNGVGVRVAVSRREMW